MTVWPAHRGTFEPVVFHEKKPVLSNKGPRVARQHNRVRDTDNLVDQHVLMPISG